MIIKIELKLYIPLDTKKAIFRDVLPSWSLLCPSRWAKYCDQHVCVWLSVSLLMYLKNHMT